jgi:hypothetical protein
MDDLANAAMRRLWRRRLLQAYKDEITDWCHFDLAIELACQKTGASEQEMRAIACGTDVWS